MQYEDFHRRVQSRALLGSKGGAIEATTATLRVLRQRIGINEANHLAAQLPGEIGGFLVDVAEDDRIPQPFSVQEFFQRVSQIEDVDVADAIVHARAVIEVLSEAVSADAMDVVRNQLPEQFHLLFEPVDSAALQRRNRKMSTANASTLRKQDCQPCHGETPPLRREEIQKLIEALPEWKLVKDGKSIERKWVAKDFAAAMELLQQIAELAEAQDHHPDLHLTGYRNVSVELTTHAIKGLSENDFIMAAKIDALPFKAKPH